LAEILKNYCCPPLETLTLEEKREFEESYIPRTGLFVLEEKKLRN
jgi:hypothetical protein